MYSQRTGFTCLGDGTLITMPLGRKLSVALTWIFLFNFLVIAQPSVAHASVLSDSSSNCQIAVTGSGAVNSSTVSVTLSGIYCVVQFLGTGSYSATIPLGTASVDYLVVGGGGGGGSGGGGAGGLLQGSNYSVTSGNAYTITVGGGGTGGRGGNASGGVDSTNGSDSVFGAITAKGGGAGGQGNKVAATGGSGGGSRYDCTNVTVGACGAAGTPGQGSNGAPSTHPGYGGGAGGGGAGGAGGNTILYHIGGNGGNGLSSSITGTPTYYAGGGGGGLNENTNSYCGLNAPGTSDSNYYCNGLTPVLNGGGSGGLGGGGRGSSYGYSGSGQGIRANATAGASNTGGGGGGTDPEDYNAGAGGSGIVVLRYVAALNIKTITFNSNQTPSSTSTQSVTSGISTPLTANSFTRSGYVFSGWNTAADGSGTNYADSANITTSNDLTLFAKWTAGVNKTVTFNANGGSGTMADQVAGSATALTPNTFIRSGYLFTGWNTVSGGTGYSYSDNASFPFTVNATLYAQWSVIVVSHTVTFLGNGATSGSTSSQTASSTQPLNLNGFSRTGYNFLGWNTSGSGAATYLDGQNYNFSSDLTLFALWAVQAPNLVTFNANGGSGTMGSQTASSNTVLNLNTFARNDYHFLNWNTLANGTGVNYSSGYTYSFAAPITLFALWSQDLTISYNGNTSDSGTVPSSQPYYAGGPDLTIQTNTGNLAKQGYSLTGWNSVANGTGTSYALGATGAKFTTSTVLYAQWAAATYVILYTGNSNTGGSAPSGQSYVYGGSALMLAANTGSLVRTNFKFTGWNTLPDGSGMHYASGATGVTISADTVLFAEWSALPNTNLSFGAAPSGISYGESAGTHSVNAFTTPLAVGTIVFGTATPLVCSVNSTSGALTILSAGNCTITADDSGDIVNYLPAVQQSQTFSVSKIALTITGLSGVDKSYDGSRTATASGTASLSGVISSDSATVTLVTSGASFIFASAGVGTGVGMTATGYTLSGSAAGNYTLSQPSGLSASILTTVVTIAPSISSSTMTFRGSTPSIGNTQSPTGHLDASPNCSLYSETDITYSNVIALTSTTSVGRYVVHCSGAIPSSGYSVTYGVNAALVISQAPQAITFNAIPSQQYSGDTFTVDAITDQSLNVSFTAASDSACTATGVNGSSIRFLRVGSCSLTANQTGNLNIAAAAPVTRTFLISARPITVTADAKTMNFNTSIEPALTYSITSSSLIGGDILTGGLSRDPGSDAGSYQILQGSLSNSNYLITYVPANFVITKIAPVLTLVYPNSGVVILSPGVTESATVATTTGTSPLNFSTTSSISICTVNGVTGLISFFAAGECHVVMGSAASSNFLEASDSATVTSILQSTSLIGIAPSKLIAMGGTFYANPVLSQTLSFSNGSNAASVTIPANALPSTTGISINILTDPSTELALITGAGSSPLTVVVSWVSPDGSVPSTTFPISVTLTNTEIKAGAKVYSIVGGVSTLVGTATSDGSVTSQITNDPVLVVVNPIAVIAPPVVSSGPAAIDSLATIAAAKALADKVAADAAALKVIQDAEILKAAQDKAIADQLALDAAAVKVAEALAATALQAARDKAAADAKSATDAASLAKAQQAAISAAQAKATADAALAAKAASLKIIPTITLYSVNQNLKLSTFDTAYLKKYVSNLKTGTILTCIGYVYTPTRDLAYSKKLALTQANALCAVAKNFNKSLKTTTITLDSSKAPKPAKGVYWTGMSYRIDAFNK